MARNAKGSVSATLLAPDVVPLYAVLVLAAFLDIFRIDRNGFANDYYATAVKSMLLNWHNFFFVAFDPGGFVSVDKPPLGLWIQAASAKLFGFSGVRLILPEALAGVGSIAILWYLVRHAFGSGVALVAAFLLAISPVNVVAGRDNIVDSLLVFTLLLAAWACVRATERASVGWLIACGGLVGLAFNIKMLQAYLIVPTLVLLFLLGARLSLWRRSIYITAMLSVMLLVSFSWVEIVDHTPASQRPYVGSSTSNSELELVLGYNGVLRILGRQPESRLRSQPSRVQSRPVDPNAPGPLRLFGPLLGSQVSWVLPLALVGIFSRIWRLRLSDLRKRKSPVRRGRRQQSFVLWVVWAVTAGIVFSAARGIAPYYLAMFAPAICVLAAVGGCGLWRDYCSAVGIRAWLLPIALWATSLEQWYLLSAAPGWLPWLAPVLLGVSLCLCLLLVVRRIPHAFLNGRLRPSQCWVTWSKGTTSLAPALISLSLFVVLAAPTLWTIGSLRNANAGGHPLSGPTLPGQETAATPTADPVLLAYLRLHADDSRYVLATLSTGDATPIIFSTGAPVMALGGFSGSDPILTVRQLKDAVIAGVVERFWLPSSNLSKVQLQRYFPRAITLQPTSYSNTLTQWVAQNCTVVEPIESLMYYSPRHVAPRVLFSCPYERKGN